MKMQAFFLNPSNGSNPISIITHEILICLPNQISIWNMTQYVISIYILKINMKKPKTTVIGYAVVEFPCPIFVKRGEVK